MGIPTFFQLIGPRPHQGIAGPQHHQILPHFPTAVLDRLDRIQRLWVYASQSGQLIRIEPIILALTTLRSVLNRGLATSTSRPQPRMTSSTHAECVPSSIPQSPPASYSTLGKRRQVPPALSATVPPPVFPPSKPKMQLMAPLVPQIHSHRQTVEIGPKLTSRMPISRARCYRFFRIQLFF